MHVAGAEDKQKLARAALFKVENGRVEKITD